MVGQAREGTPDKTGAELRMMVRSQCSINHPGHHAGAHTTRVNHEAHAIRNQQGMRPAHTRPPEWGGVRSERPGHRVEDQGTWASRTRKRSEAGCGWPQRPMESSDPTQHAKE